MLISQSSEAGELVVDPFMGSGSVGVAALRLGRRFLGNDVSDDAHAHAKPRLLELGREVTAGEVLPPNVQLALGER